MLFECGFDPHMNSYDSFHVSMLSLVLAFLAFELEAFHLSSLTVSYLATSSLRINALLQVMLTSFALEYTTLGLEQYDNTKLARASCSSIGVLVSEYSIKHRSIDEVVSL